MAVETSSLFYRSADGLRLHLVAYRASGDAARLPLICLPGLTRGAADFAALAAHLAGASATPRAVYAFDYRGRGQSDHDPHARYELAVERDDVLGWLRDNGIGAAHWLGTSRGGLILMAMAAEHRAAIRSVVLNDIGPVLEPEGLRRIKGYVGRVDARPRSLDEAALLLRLGPAQGFDGLSAEEWRLFARTTFGADDGDLRLRYDPALARALDALDLARPLPTLWDGFDALRGLPLLAVRGANSDLLSAATLAAMAERWPGCEAATVPGQGHAPLLADAPTLQRIDAFLARADAEHRPP